MCISYMWYHITYGPKENVWAKLYELVCNFYYFFQYYKGD
jgi:hypothetical protein